MKKIKNNIFISSLSVTIITVFIKFLGLLKQSTIASICGATNETDAFYVATGVIGHLTIAFFSAISVSLLSMYVDKKKKEGNVGANSLINASLHLFIPVSMLISLLFFTFSPLIAKFLAPSYIGEQFATLVYYVKIVSLAFIPWCYYLIINVILESEKSFLPGRCQGLFQNLLLIIAATFFYKIYGAVALVYAFLFSGILESILITICARKKFKFSFKATKCKDEIKKLITLSIPLIIGNAVYEINDIVDKQISTSLGSGYASILTYGATINEIVTGVIVSSVAVVLFANFASWVANNEINKVENGLKQAIEILTMLIVPIMIMCLLAGDHITWLFYGRGSLNSNELLSIYWVLTGYAAGFIFQAARSVLSRVLYAFQDTKTPMCNGIISIVINIILSLILSKIIGVMGISLATSISAFISTFLLFLGVKKCLPNFKITCLAKQLLKLFLSGIITSVVVLALHEFINLNVLFKFIIEGFSCIIIYCIFLFLVKSHNINLLLKKLNIKKNNN